MRRSGSADANTNGDTNRIADRNSKASADRDTDAGRSGASDSNADCYAHRNGDSYLHPDTFAVTDTNAECKYRYGNHAGAGG